MNFQIKIKEKKNFFFFFFFFFALTRRTISSSREIKTKVLYDANCRETARKMVSEKVRKLPPHGDKKKKQCARVELCAVLQEQQL